MIKEAISPVLGRDDVYAIATCDGSFTLYSKSYKASYHSLFGAVSESKHTYIQHCLNTQLHLPAISILEFGFGTGLNAFLAYLVSQKFKKPVDYTGLEKCPLDISVIDQLDYPGYLTCPEKKDILIKMHLSNSLTEEEFTFSRFDQLANVTSKDSFNCIFFDAFDPEVQPSLWGLEMFYRLFMMTAPGGCLVTYCAKGEVRRCMERSGYEVSRIPGAPGKRQMLQAFKPS